MNIHTDELALVTEAEMLKLVGYKSIISLRRAIERGDVPAPRKIGAKRYWTKTQLSDWLR